MRPALAEAADLLAGLRRVREDSLRIAEYNASLDLALTGQRNHHAKASKEWRTSEEERLLSHLSDRTAVEMVYVKAAAFWQWSFVKNRALVLMPFEIETVNASRQLHQFLTCRLNMCEARWCESIRSCQDDLETLVRTLQKQRAEDTQRMKQSEEKTFVCSLQSRFKNIRSTILKRDFAAWSEFTHKASIARSRRASAAKTVNLMYGMAEQEWLGQILRAWHDWTSDRLEKRGDEIYHCKAIQMSSRVKAALFGESDQGSGRFAVMVLRAWQTAAVELAQEERQKQKEFEAQLAFEEDRRITAGFPVKMLCRAIAQLAFGKIDIGSYLLAWREVSWQVAANHSEEAIRHKTLIASQLEQYHDAIYRSFRIGVQSSLDAELMQSCFVVWCCNSYHEQRKWREATMVECRALTQGTSAWEMQARDLYMWQKLQRLVDLLGRKRMKTLRYALQTVYEKCEAGLRNPAKKKVQKGIEEARARLAAIVAEKKAQSDELASVYRCARQRQFQAKHAMKRWTVERNLEMVIVFLLEWKLCAVYFRTQRLEAESQTQEAQNNESWLAQHRMSQSDHKTTATNVIGKFVVRYELVGCFNLWKLGITISQHEWSLTFAEDVWKEKQNSMRRNAGHQMTAHARKQCEQVHVRSTMKVFVAQSMAEQLAFLSWKDVYHFALPKRLVRKFVDLTCGRYENVLFSESFSYWRLAVGKQRQEIESQTVAEQTWVDILDGQRFAKQQKILCSLLSYNLDVPLLCTVIESWKKGHAETLIDKVAYDVQGEWTKWEKNAQVSLLSMEVSCHNIERFRARKLDYLQALTTARLVLKSWQLYLASDRLQKELSGRDEAANNAVEAQLHFEELAREQWIQRCIFMKDQAQCSQDVVHVLSAWQRATNFAKRERENVRDIRQAQSVLQCSEVLKRASRAEVVFTGWHTWTSKAKSRWLRRQCRRIGSVLGSGRIQGNVRWPSALARGALDKPRESNMAQLSNVVSKRLSMLPATSPQSLPPTTSPTTSFSTLPATSPQSVTATTSTTLFSMLPATSPQSPPTTSPTTSFSMLPATSTQSLQATTSPTTSFSMLPATSQSPPPTTSPTTSLISNLDLGARRATMPVMTVASPRATTPVRTILSPRANTPMVTFVSPRDTPPPTTVMTIVSPATTAPSLTSPGIDFGARRPSAPVIAAPPSPQMPTMLPVANAGVRRATVAVTGFSTPTRQLNSNVDAGAHRGSEPLLDDFAAKLSSFKFGLS